MDDLLDCYNAYEKLLNIQYRFVVARKNIEYRITIRFKWENFFHLTGMQHLTDLALIPKSKSRPVVLTKIRAKEITIQDLMKSKFRVTNNTDILCRIECLTYLDQFLASENTVFDYMNRTDSGSNIKADWMIKGNLDTQLCYLFIEGYESKTKPNRKKDDYYCKSFFPDQGIAYGSYAKHTAILLKEKVNTETSKTETLYRRSTYSEAF